MKLGYIADKLNCGLVGNGEIDIFSVAQIESAQANQITFVSNKKYAKYILTSQASAIIVDNADALPPKKSGLISTNPYLTFAEVIELFRPQITQQSSIHPMAVVSPSAFIGRNVVIGAFSVIGAQVKIGDGVTIQSHCVAYPKSTIGSNTLIHSHCIIREECIIGSNVILQNNVIIGSDGFGYAKNPDNSWKKILQLGIVIVEDEVEIGAESSIDRATLGTTIIGKGTKIDNLVQIGHGSVVGPNSLLCAQVGLAGSTYLGEGVILGGQVGVAGHLKIGDKAIATAQTGISHSVESESIVSGYPAIGNRDWLKSSALFAQLPKLQREIKTLQKKVSELEMRLN